MYHRILLIWAPYRPQRVEVIIFILLFRYRFNLVFYELYQLYRLVQKVLSYVVSIRISKVNQIRLIHHGIKGFSITLSFKNLL